MSFGRIYDTNIGSETMNDFNPLEWLEERSKIKEFDVVIEGMTFKAMVLTDKQLEGLSDCDSYEAVLMQAAELGLSFNRQRVCETEGLQDDMGLFWSKVHKALKLDPCVQQRVGESVLEESGALDEFQDVFEINVIDGDSDFDPQVTLGQLHDDAQAANA